MFKQIFEQFGLCQKIHGNWSTDFLRPSVYQGNRSKIELMRKNDDEDFFRYNLEHG